MTFARYAQYCLIFCCCVPLVHGCVMTEEVKRIDRMKEAERQRNSYKTGDLTGEQIYTRSCNSCHPGGKKGLGPSLENLNESWADDAALKKLIRSGKGTMPAQPKQVLTDVELDNLVVFLRGMNSDK